MFKKARQEALIILIEIVVVGIFLYQLFPGQEKTAYNGALLLFMSAIIVGMLNFYWIMSGHLTLAEWIEKKLKIYTQR